MGRRRGAVVGSRVRAVAAGLGLWWVRQCADQRCGNGAAAAGEQPPDPPQAPVSPSPARAAGSTHLVKCPTLAQLRAQRGRNQGGIHACHLLAQLLLRLQALPARHALGLRLGRGRAAGGRGRRVGACTAAWEAAARAVSTQQGATAATTCWQGKPCRAALAAFLHGTPALPPQKPHRSGSGGGARLPPRRLLFGDAAVAVSQAGSGFGSRRLGSSLLALAQLALQRQRLLLGTKVGWGSGGHDERAAGDPGMVEGSACNWRTAQDRRTQGGGHPEPQGQQNPARVALHRRLQAQQRLQRVNEGRWGVGAARRAAGKARERETHSAVASRAPPALRACRMSAEARAVLPGRGEAAAVHGPQHESAGARMGGRGRGSPKRL